MDHHHQTRDLTIAATPGAEGDFPGCADVLYDALASHRGIVAIEMNREARTLTLRYDPTQVSLPAVEALTQRLGLIVDRQFDSCTLELQGLTCRSCAAGLERRLAALDMVASVAINPAAASVTIAHAPGIPSARFATYVRSFGYRTRLKEQARSLWGRHRPLILSVAAGVALLAAWVAGALGGPRIVQAAGFAAA